MPPPVQYLYELTEELMVDMVELFDLMEPRRDALAETGGSVFR